MLETYIRAKHLDNSDHVFAKFLTANGWAGDTASTRDAIKYIDKDGVAIAVCYYNNANCTYTVWARRGAEI